MRRSMLSALGPWNKAPAGAEVDEQNCRLEVKNHSGLGGARKANRRIAVAAAGACMQSYITTLRDHQPGSRKGTGKQPRRPHKD